MEKFDESKHKKNLIGATQKAMYDEFGNELQGIYGVEGVVQEIEFGNSVAEFGADKIVVAAGSGFALHTHPGHHLLYVMRGKGRLHIDGVDYVMHRGDLFYVPAEYPHAMRAAKRRSLTVLALGFPHKHVHGTDRMKLVRKVNK